LEIVIIYLGKGYTDNICIGCIEDYMFERLLFIYGEARLIHDTNGNSYIDSIFDSTFWSRYFCIAKTVSICFRDNNERIPSESVEKKWRIIDCKHITTYSLFESTDSLHAFLSPRRKMLSTITLKSAISESDGVIIRLPSMAGKQAINVCKKNHKPYLVEVVGDAYASLHYHSSYGKLLAPIEYLRMRFQIKYAKYVLYVSENFLQNRYPTNGISIGCPDVNIEKIDSNIIYKRIEKISEQKDTYILGLIGSLDVNYRGHKILLQVIKKLHDEGISCKARFLGPGDPKRWEIYSRKLNINERVEFCGVLPAGPAVLSWIDDVDILVMPTKVESLGRAVIEAMSRGCPVIGTKTTALNEHLNDKCLFMPDDIDTLKKMIKKMIINKDYMKKCAYENYSNAYKYLNSVTDKVRMSFFKIFEEERKTSK